MLLLTGRLDTGKQNCRAAPGWPILLPECLSFAAVLRRNVFVSSVVKKANLFLRATFFSLINTLLYIAASAVLFCCSYLAQPILSLPFGVWHLDPVGLEIAGIVWKLPLSTGIQHKVVFKHCSGNKLAAEPFPSPEPLALPLLVLSLKTHLVSKLVRLNHQELPCLDWSLGLFKMHTFC